MPYLGTSPTVGLVTKLNDIASGFNGVTTTFQLAIPPGGVTNYFTPGTVNALFVRLGSVTQNPGVDYTVNGSQIIFTTAPTAGLTCFIIAIGQAINIGVPSDGSVSQSKLGTLTSLTLTVATPVTIPSTGIYSPSANQLAISTGGTSRFEVSTTAATSTLPVVFPLGAVGTPSITFTGNLNTGIWSPAADTIAFSEGGAEAMRIDSSGRLLVGTSTARTFVGGAIFIPVQVEGANDNNSRGASLTYGINGTSGPLLCLAKHRSNSIGGTTVVSSGDETGGILFHGSDGTNVVQSASIYSYVDGTPGANDMPGRLVFSTTGDGAASPTERMRITSAGLVGIATTTPTAQLEVGGSVGLGTTRAAYLRYPSDSASSARTTFEITANESGVEKAAFRVMGDGSIQGNTYAGVVVRNSAGTEIARFQDAGLKFPATQVASADPNTLDDYEEGTWTPSQGAGLTVVGAYSSSGFYTKIGKVVHVFAALKGATSIASSTGGILCGGLPFTPVPPLSGFVVGSMMNHAQTQSNTCSAIGSTNVYGTVAVSANVGIYFAMTYYV